MKHLIMITLILLFSYNAGADVDLVSSEEEVSSGRAPAVVPAPDVEREVASEKKEITTYEYVDNDEKKSKLSLQLSNHFLQGNIYFGGRPTPIQLNSYTFDVSLLKESHFYNARFDYVYNQASIKLYNLSFGAGYKKDLGRFNFMLGGNLGLVNYQENSLLQNISAYGPSLSAVAAVNFYVTDSLYLNANYKYSHYMFTDGLSFWGSNPRGDVVFDFQGLGLGLGWSF